MSDLGVHHEASERGPHETDAVGKAMMVAAVSLGIGILAVAITVSIISAKTSGCTPNVFDGTTCPPYVHNYTAAYVIGAVTGTIVSYAVLFIIIAKAVEHGIRAARQS